jgi:hypothetical protein
MAENDFLEDVQDRLSDLIWKGLIWALVATFGWGVRTALQVNDLAALAKESTVEVSVLKDKVDALNLRVIVLETKLEKN